MLSTPMVPEKTSSTLNAIRSPLLFNAFAVISLAGVTGTVAVSSLPDWFKICCVTFTFSWTAGVSVWINRTSRRDPRGLAYGPKEYLEESKMEHQRKLKGIQ
jgi:hypothetical protein